MFEVVHGPLVSARGATRLRQRSNDGGIDTNPKGDQPGTVGADKGYDTRDFVRDCRDRSVTPHVAQNQSGRRSAIDARTTRHPGSRISQTMRIEEIFSWAKTVGNFARTRLLGIARTQHAAYLVGTAYNLMRMAKLVPLPP